ncbi:DUF2269 family protein [Paenibacillus thermotolerans]|uniref:DUF2269 family protein n=1 Tax=Paenibacillus thermotolerans TaxID=3027807 RepID=UPI0023677801|nr:MULTISPECIES: DUF2269 family protein [unclassified Paenibacillus]
MKWLVLIHVLSAIIGVGPTFFSHILLREKQSLSELKHSLSLMKKLEFFPKIGGSLAVLTGLALILLNNYGTFLQTWLIGSLILYILIQIVAAGLLPPRVKKIAAIVEQHDGSAELQDNAEFRRNWSFVNRWMYVATGLGTILFIFMIVKPV